MKRIAPMLAFALLAMVHTVSAQATRTWVSGVGDDANPGSRTAPCKTFAGAISKTAANGTISVLDPGGFGAVTVTKSMTIDGGGIEGSILASGTNGVIVNAGVDDVVVLRNLVLEGAGTGLVGVKILSAGAVYLENCRIKGFATGVAETTSATTGTQVILNNCFIHECSTAAVTLEPGADVASVAKLENTRLEGCGLGLSVGPRSKAFLTDCTVAFNVGAGLVAFDKTTPIFSFGDNQVFGNNPDGAATKVVRKK
jgi:hypothetical protein